MRAHISKISSLAFEKVHYYTVRLDEKEITEFGEFFSNFRNSKKEELAEINRYLKNIGNKYGALPNHFKTEDAAEALPPPYHQYVESEDPNDYGLRLYCIRLTPSIVLLLNGGQKTALKVQDCKNCFKHFDLARKLAKALTEAMRNKDIEIDEEDEKNLIIYDDFELTF